eukprot:13288879-Alexandrium_andersonii.AAC.1
MALRRHELLIRKHVPERWRPRQPIGLEALARPYTTIKGKCLDKAGSGLSCSKSHAHDREIVACPDHAARGFMRSTARAARLLQKLSARPGWTLWRMSDIAPELVARVQGLAMHPHCACRCPCGRPKLDQLSL